MAKPIIHHTLGGKCLECGYDNSQCGEDPPLYCDGCGVKLTSALEPEPEWIKEASPTKEAHAYYRFGDNKPYYEFDALPDFPKCEWCAHSTGYHNSVDYGECLAGEIFGHNTNCSCPGKDWTGDVGAGFTPYGVITGHISAPKTLKLGPNAFKQTIIKTICPNCSNINNDTADSLDTVCHFCMMGYPKDIDKSTGCAAAKLKQAGLSWDFQWH